MWSKVAKLASPAPRKPSSSSPSVPSFSGTVDQLRAILSRAASSSSETGRSPTQTQETVARLLGDLLRVLKAETSSGGASPLGPATESLLLDGVLGELVDLVGHDEPHGAREELVRWYGRAIVQLDEGWLSHSAVNKPLVKLLRSCVDEDGGLRRQEELAVVEVMCIVAERIKTRPELLAIFFREKSGSRRPKDLSSSIAAAMNRPVPLTTISTPDADGRPASPTLSQASTSEASASFAPSQASSTASPPRRADHDFLLFSYLLRFIHREGDVGDYAREGILSLVDVAFGYPNLYNPSFALQRTSSSSTISPSSVLTPPTSTSAAREAVLAFAEYLLDSDFAEVLGAGLGALYGLLPGKLVVRKGEAAGEATPQDGATAGGGMVLGGMGALHSEEDADELERKKEDEEMRLMSEGYGLSDTGEFKQGLDGFLKLVEFTQDILRRSTDGILLEQAAADEDEDSDDLRQQKLVMNALTSAVLGAVKNLFLQSVLYPSILECSETDGSAVAVMSYLDAMLEVVQEGTKLEGAVLGYLLAEEDTADLALRSRLRASNGSSKSSPSAFLSPQPSSSKVKRRKSSALLLIESAGPAHADHADYFTSLGRFSLRDLLLSHLHSSSQPTAAAALKLLQTLLTKHDRWSLALLDVTLDDGATAFPIALRDTPPVDLDDESDYGEAFVYRPSAAPFTDSSSDEDEFTYPSTPRAAPTSFPHTPAHATRALLGQPLPSTPSVALHLDSLDTLLSLVGTIDPSYRRMRASGGGSEILNTGFANHLRDAESTLANDAGFKRGLMAPPTMIGEDGEASGSMPKARRRRSTLFGAGVLTLTGRDFAAASSGYRHKLRPSAKLVGLLLQSLAAFFSHSPEVNLTLTAVIAALATNPYRSLGGWLLPVVRPLRGEDVEERGERSQGRHMDDGDDRSVDYEVDERGRHDALLSPRPSASAFLFDPSNSDNPPSATRAALSTSDTVLSVLDALAQSVEHYRRSIPGFDTFLSERRQGLFFAENLADALQADDLGGLGGVEENAFGPPAPPPAAPVVEPPAPPKKSSSPSLGLGSFFSPRRPSAGHKRAPSSPVNAFSTPTKATSNPHAPNRPSQLRRSASDESLALPASPSPFASSSSSAATSLAPPPQPKPEGKGPASPFAAHYLKTGSIIVQPIVVSTPGSAQRMRALGGDGSGDLDDADADDDDGAGPPDSPSRRLSAAPRSSTGRSPRSSSPSGRSTASSSAFTASGAGADAARAPPGPPPVVSLSTILDNVIVLEEAVKELAAIVYVRRAVGIDAVRFV
ncbi:hypothetical protein JCM10207_004361 [Rhodosporidiobolus poonsookiae]